MNEDGPAERPLWPLRLPYDGPVSIQIDIRPYDPADAPAVVEVLQAALRWPPDDRYLPFFRWKHEENPAGPTAAWVALAGEQVVGFRAFVRWPLAAGRERVAAARAVDTAVHPEWQRRGVFSRLTEAALAELPAAGVDLVFNTPNPVSQQGYEKYGWQILGRLPVGVRLRRPASLLALARARGRAEKWSLPTEDGVPALKALADTASIERLLAAQPPVDEVHTHWSVDFLRWRYGFEPLAYRAVLAGNDPGDGLAIVRLRRRGAAVEVALCDVLVPGADQRGASALVRRASQVGRGDHALCLRGGHRSPGFVPLPGQGPMLAARSTGPDAAAVPARDHWRLTLGAVELF